MLRTLAIVTHVRKQGSRAVGVLPGLYVATSFLLVHHLARPGWRDLAGWGLGKRGMGRAFLGSAVRLLWAMAISEATRKWP